VLAACGRLPDSELTFPFGPGTSVFKISGKMFAAVGPDSGAGRLTVKCDPDYATFLVQQFDEITPGYHMNKRHWITVVMAPSLPIEMVEDLISDSYDLVKGPSARREGRGSPTGP
jgi:predicted DNA-binding protein (MmcQ/YjbR family)